MVRVLPVLLLLLASPALALPEGRFAAAAEGADGVVTVGPQSFAIEVATAGCAGGATGTWAETGPGQWLVTVPAEEPDLPTCTIAITEAGGVYEMLETGCLFWHGSACGFSGTFDPAVPAR